MIELTVRTLDSQNHQFSVEDDITVAQFKQKIAETVSIPPETQRIIYCGRVLNDDTKLNEYDVNGKVVHLVERAPPTENQARGNGPRAHSPQPTPHRVLGGNAMYLGSMAIPLEHQNIMPPPPSHSLAASRLNVARRMLRRAEAVINLLENPTARPTDTTPAREPQEEVTPVFEARVIVPTTNITTVDATIYEEFVLNAMQNSLLNAATVPSNLLNTSTASTTSAVNSEPSTTSTEASTSATEATVTQSNTDSDSPPVRSVSSTPEGVSPISTSTEDLANEGRSAGSNTDSGFAENASRTSEMAELLQTLTRLQTRFAPFQEMYTNFMREDPTVPTEDIRKTQAMMNRVSEVLHFLGHAYHSLSDIIIRVRRPPPRPLLCRPILIQHSAVLQAGFPIQVEAQINFASDNEPSPSATTNTTQPSASQNETNSTDQSIPSTNSNPPPTANANPNIVSFPFMPPSAVHVSSFPIGIRTMRPNSANRSSSSTTSNTTNTTNSPPTNTTGNTTNTTNAGNFASSFNNPNLEFFMEVTPESITIDSLETTLLGASQGMAGGAPPPELLQSIVQIASHLVNRGGAGIPTNIGQQPAASSAASTTGTSTESSQAAPNTTNSGQNSQARGNTQTNPTTATHTRSTARPHVHLAQHAMQGFDPFLPCNSHHISQRRRAPTQPRNVTINTQTNNNTRAQNGNTNPNQFNPVYNIVQGVLSSLQNMYGGGVGVGVGRRTTPQTQSSTTAQPTNTATAAGLPTGLATLPIDQLSQIFTNIPNLPNILPHLQNITDARGPTIAQILQSGDQQEGEGIFNDLIMLLSRNFTIGDVLQLNAGRLDPLMRIRNELRTFITERILDGNPSPTNICRSVNRVLTEIQPFIGHLSRLQVRDNIDIVRSTQMLFRARLPNIVNLAVSRTPNSIRSMVEQIRHTSRLLCALILHSSSNGQRGVEDVLSHIVTRYMEGISMDMQEWTILATRAQLQQFMRSLNVPPSALQPYIVRNVDSVTSTDTVEPMDLDTPINESDMDQASGSTSVLGVINIEASDDLPAVVIGSEPWHGQVPSDWVPIITRDTQRQRRQNQQTALSDAYLGGMPSKRRKIVTNNKPQGSLPQVITESVRRAVTATGFSSIGNLEAVAQEAGSDLSIQAAYRELLRSRVQNSIQDNEDFTPERFPNATNYFNKSQ